MDGLDVAEGGVLERHGCREGGVLERECED
jgi:hypothetical protein